MIGDVAGIETALREQRELHLVADAIAGAVPSHAIPPDLLGAATRHGVLGLFPIPHPQFQRSMIANQAMQLRALKYTRRVIAAIVAAGVPVVVLKGVAAGSRWKNPALRQQSDVDVLVHYDRKDEAARALIAAGICKERFLDSHDMHNDSLSPAEPSGMLVEVHHDFSNHHDARIDVHELLARRVKLQTLQGLVPALAPEDDAVFLALHAATHALMRLAWLVDLAALSVDWVEAARRARSWNVALPVELAWRRTRDLLRVPIPEAAFNELGISSAHARIARTILAGADASQGHIHRFLERSFRLSVVPVRSLPGVIARKLRARREEHDAYAKKARPRSD